MMPVSDDALSPGRVQPRLQLQKCGVAHALSINEATLGISTHECEQLATPCGWWTRPRYSVRYHYVVALKPLPPSSSSSLASRRRPPDDDGEFMLVFSLTVSRQGS